jgi:hypothetical protein
VKEDRDLPDNYQVVYNILYKHIFISQAKDAKEKEDKKRKAADLKQKVCFSFPSFMFFLFSHLRKTKRKIFKSPEFVPDHWLAEEEATSKASSPVSRTLDSLELVLNYSRLLSPSFLAPRRPRKT